MPASLDKTDFVDGDYEAARRGVSATTRPPTREELESKVTGAQQKLAELRRMQDELERERSALEEARRRQAEFHTGRVEMEQHLARGIGLLEEAEFSARRDAEQMAKTLVELREALEKLKAISEETWTNEAWNVELTRALTTIENARMEWNSARLKWPILNNSVAATDAGQAAADAARHPSLSGLGFFELCRLGLAFTWPLVALGLGIFLLLVLKK